jgi:hypothetical protein
MNDDRLELVDEYMAAKVERDRALARYEAAKSALKPMGTWRDGDVHVEVSVTSRETVSLTDLKKAQPQIVEHIRALGFIKQSESERLTVKIKPNEEDLR